ncbi:MAG: ribonuclease R [Candidatus Zixiibacteriota bacterium]
MPLNKKTILDFIRAQADRPMKIKEIATAMRVPQTDYQALRRGVKQLIDSGELINLKRGRVGVPDQLGVIVGTMSITRKGIGFLMREGVEPDILIQSWDLHTALDGDQAMVRLKGKVEGREAGSVIRIVKRADRNIVGVFHSERKFAWVTPDNPRIHRDIYIPIDATDGAQNGEKVVAKLTLWDDPHLNPEGRIVERIGFPNDPGVDMLTIVKSYGFPESFPAEVMDEAERAAAKLAEDSQSHRLDLSHECIYTIDPFDAKDHDDAVGVEETAYGYRLGVHIADVSYYVEAGSALDVEAFNRGNSVYLPGMVIPMLPEVLSNDICSLKPHRKRLAHSVFIDFDRQGRMHKWQLADTIINSKAKLSYEEVQDLFDGKPVASHVATVADNLLLARRLAQLLSKQRFAEGSLDFDLPEAKIILGKDGEVIELGSRVRLESHRLVEEFMLAANKAVALEVFRKAQPFLYRVHDKPDLEKLEAFSYMMERLGYKFPVSKTMRPIQFSRFLDSVKDAPEVDLINELLLRSMAKAVYQRENIGHFGLAFSHYTHFTSPIRRYPDLLVHRLLRKLKGKRYPVAFARRVESVIDNVGKHCSETERMAEAAEREAVRVKQVAYMAAHLGDEYTGVISGVMPFGFFVRLDRLGVEGLVRVSSIDDDFYRYDEQNFRIVGTRTKRIYRLGDAVKVGVMKVDRTRNEIDLFLIRPKPEKAKAKKNGVGKKRRRKRS